MTCQERSVFSATEFWFWNEEPGFALTSSPESVNLKIDPTGKAFVTLHAPFWGNSPETIATQIVAEHLTMSPEDIHITYADTDHGLNGTGPGGSRYTVMIAGAIAGASGKIKSKLMKVASSMLEAAEEDLELADGAVRIQGSDRSVSIAEIALQAHYFRLSLPDDVNSGIDASHVYDHPYTTMPSEDRSDLGVFYPIMGHMCHIPVIEIDAETGRIEFLDYVAVHDCGTVVNPMTLAGHVRGGTAQGIGSAVYEHFHYDEDGQLLAGTYADYLIPTLKEVPANIRVGHVETPSPFTEFGNQGRRRRRPDGRPAGDRGGSGGCAASAGGEGGRAADHADAAAGAHSGGDGRRVAVLAIRVWPEPGVPGSGYVIRASRISVSFPAGHPCHFHGHPTRDSNADAASSIYASGIFGQPPRVLIPRLNQGQFQESPAPSH